MKTSSILLAACLFVSLSAGARAQTPTQLYAVGDYYYKAADIEEAKRNLQLALQVDRNFVPASALLNRIASEQHASAPALTSSEVEFLRQQAEAISRGRAKVSFVLPPELAQKRITLRLGNVPFLATLRYIGELAGVNFQMEKYAMRVRPASASTPPLATIPAPAP